MKKICAGLVLTTLLAISVQAGAATVAAPQVFPSPKTYGASQNVYLYTTEKDATIRYTTDGSIPTCSTGSAYSKPFKISKTTTVKAVTCMEGKGTKEGGLLKRLLSLGKKDSKATTTDESAVSEGSISSVLTSSYVIDPNIVKSALNIYLSPSGNDANEGLSSDKPVKTLVRALAIVKAKKPTSQDVRVNIASGTYSDQEVSWDYSMEKNSISFIGSASDRPVFECSKCGNKALFFALRKSSGKPTNIVFENLVIKNYKFGGINLWGYFENVATRWNGYNVVRNVRFENIGAFGYAMLKLENSDFNIIENNQFFKGPGDSGLHGIYISWDSDSNLIAGNSFEQISGHGLKIRDASDNNVVLSNKFKNNDLQSEPGWEGLITHELCDKRLRSDCPKPTTVECPSKGTIVKNNCYDAALTSNTEETLGCSSVSKGPAFITEGNTLKCSSVSFLPTASNLGSAFQAIKDWLSGLVK